MLNLFTSQPAEGALTTRWEVEDAVLSSKIEPPGRHILLTLLSRTNANTAEIPARHVPSFTDLEGLTGYSRSTLIEWMKTLTESHWISRVVLDGDSRPCMRVDVGDPNAARPKRSRASKKVDAPYRLAVQPEGGTVPLGGTHRTAERYSAVPPGGTADSALLLMNSPTESSNPTTNLDQAASDAAATQPTFDGVTFPEQTTATTKTRRQAPKTKGAPEKETAGQRTNRIAKLYTDKVKLGSFHGVRQAVDAAFKTGDYSEEQITAAITEMAANRLPVSQTSLRIAIEGLPNWSARDKQPRSGSRSNQHVPHLDREDISAYKTSRL